jgi:hypothetical protein
MENGRNLTALAHRAAIQEEYRYVFNIVMIITIVILTS